MTWWTLQSVVERVVADLRNGKDRLTGIRRIGIDERAWRKGHRHTIVVTDHDTGRLIWAAGGRNKETLKKFFNDLGPERSALLTHVTADGADWIHSVVQEKAPQAPLCLDAFQAVKRAGDALDKVRSRIAGLTGGQRASLAQIAADNKQLYKAYLIKEQLREVFRAKGEHGKALR